MPTSIFTKQSLLVSFLAPDDEKPGVSCNENEETNSPQMLNISGCENEDSFI